jgi:UDP-glucose 4-epimerase
MLNLGTGVGNTVRQVIEAVERVSGRKVPVVEGPRRPGDPPALYANAGGAGRLLHWTPRFSDIDTTVETAWRWHEKHGR